VAVVVFEAHPELAQWNASDRMRKRKRPVRSWADFGALVSEALGQAPLCAFADSRS
jgi:hypothetical protein